MLGVYSSSSACSECTLAKLIFAKADNTPIQAAFRCKSDLHNTAVKWCGTAISNVWDTRLVEWRMKLTGPRYWVSPQ